ncbi:CsbD family protein [Leptolyngbya sp. AN03gr2]|uniref:CsbD family protein n=1 Tax=unclassified Leptolyngbya TaxID=2650499 RepID=UPI003D30EFA2
MSLEERAKAAAKNVEGKAQEAMGNITNDPADKMAGQAKQTEAEARNAKEDVKDAAKDVVDRA